MLIWCFPSNVKCQEHFKQHLHQKNNNHVFCLSEVCSQWTPVHTLSLSFGLCVVFWPLARSVCLSVFGVLKRGACPSLQLSFSSHCRRHCHFPWVSAARCQQTDRSVSCCKLRSCAVCSDQGGFGFISGVFFLAMRTHFCVCDEDEVHL